MSGILAQSKLAGDRMKMKGMLNHTNAELKQANAEQKTNHFASKFPLSDGIRKVMAGIAIVSALNFGSGLVSKADLFVKSAYAQDEERGYVFSHTDKKTGITRVMDYSHMIIKDDKYIEVLSGITKKAYDVEYKNGVLTFSNFNGRYELSFDFRENNELREFTKKKLMAIVHFKDKENGAKKIEMQFADDTNLIITPYMKDGKALMDYTILTPKKMYKKPKSYDEIVEEGAKKVYDVEYDEERCLIVFRKWYKGWLDIFIPLKQLLEPYKDAKIRKIFHVHADEGDFVILGLDEEGNTDKFDVTLAIRPVIYSEKYIGYEYLLVYDADKYGKR